MFLGACSLLTDLSGLSGGAGVAGDAASPPPASGLDAAGGTEGGTTTDAALDGPPSTTPLCGGSAKHVLCTTFDDRDLDADFDLVTPGLGTIARNGDQWVSRPFSLRITHPGGLPASTPAVQKAVALTGLGGLRCRLRYRRELTGGGVLVLFVVELKTGTPERLFAELKDGNTNGRIYLNTTAPDGGVIDDFPTIPTFSAAGTGWANVEWTLNFETSKSLLRSDSVDIDSRTFAPIDGSKVTSAVFTVGLGNFNFGVADSPWRVRVDDLVCDAL